MLGFFLDVFPLNKVIYEVLSLQKIFSGIYDQQRELKILGGGGVEQILFGFLEKLVGHLFRK